MKMHIRMMMRREHEFGPVVAQDSTKVYTDIFSNVGLALVSLSEFVVHANLAKGGGAVGEGEHEDDGHTH
ncbi:hypothetical protein ACFL1X_11700 [Candidatus Hydrogenedentota bacterium]